MFAAIERWLEPSDKTKALVDPVFRLLVSLIFIIGGLGHFREHQMMLERMEASPWRDVVRLIGDPSVLLWLSGVAFIAAGISLALGFLSRASALVLFITLVPVTIAIHLVPDPEHVGPLFKNIAILGALLLIWARGPGAYSLDGNRERQIPKSRN
jgi:putative oxidoreductase